MRSFSARFVAWALGALCVTSVASAQVSPYGSPSLLPLPAVGPSQWANQPAAYQQGINRMMDRRPASLTLAAPNAAPNAAMYASRTAAPAPVPQGGYEAAPSPSDLPAPSAYPAPAHERSWLDQNAYQGAMQSPWGCGDATCGPTCGPSCAQPVCGGCCNWFGGVYGLYMTRDHGNHYYFSYDDANEVDQRTDSRNSEWGGGFEVRFGRYFCCRQYGLEVAYWGLFPDGETSVTHDYNVTGNLNGILNWDQLDYNGATADQWVNNAVAHRVRRDFEVHNVELNLIKFPMVAACGYDGCGSKLNLNWLCGVRFFRFTDDLEFAADTVNDQFVGDAEEIYYNIDLKNNLVGFQIGGQCDYCPVSRLSLRAGVTMGLYNNHITHNSWIGGSAGDAVINNGPNNAVPFRVDSSKDDVALLGEVKLGLVGRVTSCCSATLGYRAVAVTGVALPTNQIYPDLRGIQDVAIVDSNGSLILHGGYAGLEFNY